MGNLLLIRMVCMVAGFSFAFSANAKTYFVHNDHLGTPQVITDENKNVMWEADKDPWGNTTHVIKNSLPNNIPLPGQYSDAETGYADNWWRPYDSKTGQYLQSDPLGLRGGINTYSYSYQNPVMNIDFTGLEVTMVCRPVNVRGISGTGVVHCFVMVWHWEDDKCGKKQKVIDGQYSIGGGRKRQNPSTDPDSTYAQDRNAFNNPDQEGQQRYEVPPPPGMSQADFDAAVKDSGSNYKSEDPYRAAIGPNSNTAAHDIIDRAGGEPPSPRGALQYYHSVPYAPHISD